MGVVIGAAFDADATMRQNHSNRAISLLLRLVILAGASLLFLRGLFSGAAP
jgi:hypothetical protein